MLLPSVALAVSAAFAAVSPAPAVLPRLPGAFESARDAVRLMRERASMDQTLAHRLGPLQTLLGAAGEDEAWMSARVVAGLKSGREDALVLGESHSDAGEIAAGLRFLADAMDAGIAFKELVREELTFTGDKLMKARGVPVTQFRTPFKPAPEIAAALKRKAPGLVATYSGHAHSSTPIKDYLLKNLEKADWLRIKDMPTIEDALRDGGRRPLIIAMMGEEGLLRRIQWLFLRELAKEKRTLAESRRRLEDLRDMWLARVPQTVPAKGLRFAPLPGAGSTYAGLTAGARRPAEVDALVEVMGTPEAQAWAGTDPLSGYESLWGRGPAGVTYEVVLRKAAGPEFRRTLLRGE